MIQQSAALSLVTYSDSGRKNVYVLFDGEKEWDSRERYRLKLTALWHGWEVDMSLHKRKIDSRDRTTESTVILSAIPK